MKSVKGRKEGKDEEIKGEAFGHLKEQLYSVPGIYAGSLRGWRASHLAYMPGHLQTSGSHTLWGPPAYERPGIYARYKI